MNGKLYESDYEQAFCQLLEEQGWTLSHGDTIHRQYTDALLEDDLRTYLQDRYCTKGVPSEDIEHFIARIRNVGGATDYERHKAAFKLYHDGFDYNFADNSKPAIHIDYIDFSKEDYDNNIFRAVNQFEMQEGKMHRRPDIMLFINGIPIGIIELKNPTDPNATIRNAQEQICNRYRRDIYSLLQYCALACISDGSNTRMGTVFTPYEFFYAWKKVENSDKVAAGIDEMRTMIAGALSPERITQILQDYIYIPDNTDDDKEIEIVSRYPQYFATELLRDNIISHLRSQGGDGKGGTYFGATGCGKTYTMLFLAKQLAQRCKAKIGSPTILIIVDREDLEDQTGEIFCNAKTYLDDSAIEVFESREALGKEMQARQSGGVYVTTIQKFTKSTGLLNDRSNIICFSDEAHRSQTSIGSKLKINKKDEDPKKLGAFITYGFAQYLREALPNATYVGFTGTPIDDTIHVFGAVVDKYTMRQANEDGITVPISYMPRLARVFADSEEIKKIEKFYADCAKEGTNKEEIEKSKEAMSSLEVILGDPKRLGRLAVDMVTHYEAMLDTNPAVVQKAMVVCSNRQIAYDLYKIIAGLRPQWMEAKKSPDDSKLSEDALAKLTPVPLVNIIATRDDDKDSREMYELLGTKEHRKALSALFKDDKSNFQIAIVVDMWITGFDVPCLSVMYNDKPLQKHSLIQTISRVNRKYEGKERGLIVDYLGIRENMKKALKQYGGDEEDTTTEDDLDKIYKVFANELSIIKEAMTDFDFTPFFGENALLRLQVLQSASEFILAHPSIHSEDAKGKPKELTFVTFYRGHIKRLKAAYNILNPAGRLSQEEIKWSQCLMGICSFLGKITNDQHDAESMNKVVEEMLKEALNCSGVESIIDAKTEEELFSEALMTEIADIKMPNTKFQLLAKMLARAIKEYGKTNNIKAQQFKELLDKTLKDYNTRDNRNFAPQSAKDVVNAVSEEVLKKIESLTKQLEDIFDQLKLDKAEFKKLGISFEEKAFYDILVHIRDRQGFEYADEKCIDLAKKIKELVDNSSVYADWLNNNNIRARLADDLLDLLCDAKYPPEWNNEVFDKVLSQVNNYKNNQ